MSCKADVLKIRLRLTFLSLSLGMNGQLNFTGAVTFMKLHQSCLRQWRSASLCVGTTQALMLLGSLPTIDCKESDCTAKQHIDDATASLKMNDQ